jgi:RpiR family carbohydrate utilization transcriptional regulator|nr:MurR/RpiR family transcriptional regulator [uncultured Anaerostipes sp.]
MSKDILVRDRIFSIYDSLYDAEKKAADYLIAHQEDVINMSVSELAQNCDTSQATIIRFCKKIGCGGFHQLKLKLAGEQSRQEEPAASNEINIDNMEQSLHNIMTSKVEEIKATFHNFDKKDLRQVVDAILKADLIEFAAMGNTIPIAMDGTYKFNQLGLHAVTSPIWETQEAFARTMKEGDVFFAISASGASKRLIRMAEIVKKRGGVTVVITNQSRAPLTEICDHVIITATREHVFYDQVSFTRMAAMAVIDTLFMLLLSTKDDFFENVAEHERSVIEEKL